MKPTKEEIKRNICEISYELYISTSKIQCEDSVIIGLINQLEKLKDSYKKNI